MKIGLLAVDGHHFPNLALMKISAFHRHLGNSVEWVNHFEHYDIVYASKIFTWTPDNNFVIIADQYLKGGTGYNYTFLPEEIEHCMPDYSLYPYSAWYDRATAYGYVTRGCCNHCPWCIVPIKEGYIHAHAGVEEFLGDKKKVILMDNNILAHIHGLNQIEVLIKKKIKTDFNQGLDARRIFNDTYIINLLSQVKYIRYLRLACDTESQIEPIVKTFERLKAKGISPAKIFVYCLIRDDLEDAIKRIEKIRELKGQPFAMPFRDFKPDYKVPALHKAFARWVNRKELFTSVTWENYKRKMNLS